MRRLIATFLLSWPLISTGQNDYVIGKTIWRYTKPSHYKIRVDNFSSITQKGDSVIRESTGMQYNAEETTILISLAKTDSFAMNAIVAEFQRNSNIEKFTFKGYIDKLVEFLKFNYRKLESDVQVSIRETIIDNISFYIVESKIYHQKADYTYWNVMYIAEMDKKEFSISAIYDNEEDKNIIENSISASKFLKQ